MVNLQSLGEQLVHLGKLGGDAQVDCPVANLDDEATDDVRVDLDALIRIWDWGGKGGGELGVQCS